jgi:hypothetical protein
MNTHDPKNPTSFLAVLDALRTERAYQKRRWGYRQPDGSLREAQHSLSDFVIYMQDYYNEACHLGSRRAGNTESREALRKVICLGFACFEQLESMTFDEVVDDILGRRQSGYILPLKFNPDYGNYLLRIGKQLERVFLYADVFNHEYAMFELADLLLVGVECFEQYGITWRDLTNVVNGRDGRPA